MTKSTDKIVTQTYGSISSPKLPENWRAVARFDRRVFQRSDIDHYIVDGSGTDGWVLVLCSQGSDPYPAPLATVHGSDDSTINQGIQKLAEKSNELVAPATE